MYGTVARMRVKPGMDSAITALRGEDGARTPPGHVGILVYRSDADPQVYYLAVVFASKEAYLANANSAEQHADYLRMRALLEEDPEWHDGEVVEFGFVAQGGG